MADLKEEQKPPTLDLEMDIQLLKEALKSLDGEMDQEKRNLMELQETVQQLQHNMNDAAEAAAAGHCSKLKWRLRLLERRLENEIAAV